MIERHIDKPLLGQTILVTGASGGIGAAIVERVALEGGRPIIHYCRDEHTAETLLERIDGNGLVLQADLSDVDGPFELWRKAVDFAGRVHGLVNNAGIRTEISIESSPGEWRAAWQNEFQVNFSPPRIFARKPSSISEPKGRAHCEHSQPSRPARERVGFDPLCCGERGNDQSHQIYRPQLRPRGRIRGVYRTRAGSYRHG